MTDTTSREEMQAPFASRTARVSFEQHLNAFMSSSAKFRIVNTINPTDTAPRTLYILDSSFNPPSRAHLELATSALRNGTDSGPHRLLLLFSTHNADKAPSPASFAQRLCLMRSFAQDLRNSISKQQDVSIDIGLTKEPYYTDKSTAIAATTPPAYPSAPTHVHLIGFDTLVRFCNPKYYTNSSPPLAALAPFFDAGHKLRATLRPSDEGDESSKEYGDVEAQKAYLRDLREGKVEKNGFKREWGERIELVEGGEGVGISSTRVRRAAERQDWSEVERLCSESVASKIKFEELYKEDSSGKKMMG